MKKITKKEMDMLKSNLDKMEKSNEQFIFMLFKNPDGTDNITQYSYNIIAEKLGYYLKEALNSGEIREC